jgi:purine-nucleoside phosphorylase
MDNETKAEEIRQNIINFQAQALLLKTQADNLLAEAQEKSVQRLDLLEQMQTLAREYKKLKDPTALD